MTSLISKILIQSCYKQRRSHIKTLIFITLDTSKKGEYKINSVNPLYLLVHRIDGFIAEKRGNKYLNIAFTDSNSKVSKNMQKFGVEVDKRSN